MSDEYTETTEQGWFSRITESIKSVLAGGLMFLIAFPVLFLNECGSVETAKNLEAGKGAVISVSPDKVDPGNDTRLIHFTSQAKVDESLSDDEFGVQINAIKLVRTVEMYQWVEKQEKKTEKKTGGKKVTKTKYKYKKDWASKAYDSSNFKVQKGHNNPGSMPYQGEEKLAKKVTTGAFILPESLIGSISNYEALKVDQETIKKLPAEMQKRTKLHNGGLYIGKDPTSPKIGDVRVTFKVVKPCIVSVFGGQSGNTLKVWKKGDRSVSPSLTVGSKTADEMFTAAEEANVMFTWILRLVGFLMMFFGIRMVFSPLVVVADVLPIVGSMLGVGVSLFAGLVAFSFAFITIAVAWISARPLLGIPLLLLGIGAIVALVVMSKKKKAAAAAG